MDLLAFLPPFQRPMRFFVSPAFSFCCIWPGGSARPASRPLNFWRAAAFQMINPKGLIILASAISVYSSFPDGVANALVVMLPLFLNVTVFSACTWCFFGTLTGRLLTEDRALRRFIMIMAMLLVLSLLPMLTE